MGEAALAKPRHQRRKVHSARARGECHVLRMPVVLHRHAGHQAVDGTAVLDRIELAVAVVADVARVVHQREVLMADQLDGPAQLRPCAGGAPVGLEDDGHLLLGGVVAALGDGLAGVGESRLIAHVREQDRPGPCGGTVVDHLPQAFSARMQWDATAVGVGDCQASLRGLLAHLLGFFERGGRCDHTLGLRLGTRQRDVLEAGLGNGVHGHAIVLLGPRTGPAADQPASILPVGRHLRRNRGPRLPDRQGHASPGGQCPAKKPSPRVLFRRAHTNGLLLRRGSVNDPFSHGLCSPLPSLITGRSSPAIVHRDLGANKILPGRPKPRHSQAPGPPHVQISPPVFHLWISGTVNKRVRVVPIGSCMENDSPRNPGAAAPGTGDRGRPFIGYANINKPRGCNPWAWGGIIGRAGLDNCPCTLEAVV